LIWFIFVADPYLLDETDSSRVGWIAREGQDARFWKSARVRIAALDILRDGHVCDHLPHLSALLSIAGRAGGRRTDWRCIITWTLDICGWDVISVAQSHDVWATVWLKIKLAMLACVSMYSLRAVSLPDRHRSQSSGDGEPIVH